MDLPAHMSGVLLTAHGGPEVLRWSDRIPVPVPRAGEVLVRVSAAGVNNTDIATREGWYGRGADGDGASGWAGAMQLPRIQGADLCGRVVAVGPEVRGITTGMRVTCGTNQPEPLPGQPVRFVAIGSEYDGAFAQFAVVPARHLHDVSASPLGDIEIAAMPCAYGTALNLLQRAGVGADMDVLVTGASGGVGLAAVALAAHLGARPVGICQAGKSAAVLAAGAVAVLGRGEHIPREAFDGVIDVVGGAGWPDRIEALRPGGRVAVAGAIAGPDVETDLRRVYLRDVSIFGCTYQPPEVFARLVDIINGGRVRPLVSRTYPLRDIARAQADFVSKSLPGKLVLIPPEISA